MRPDLVFEEFAPQRHRGRRAMVALIAVTCAAFTVRETVDLLGWRDIGSKAREIASSANAGTQHRVDAMTVGCRDTRAWIITLRQIAEVGGEEGLHARNFLSAIDAAQTEPLPAK